MIDASSAEIDAYGRTLNVSKGVGQSYQIGSSRETYKYVYPEIQESKFVSKPTSCQSADTNTAKQYKYDSDDNLIGWSETEGSKTVLDVRQITPNTTKYKFGEDEPEYFVEVNHDKNATAAPRMESVVVKLDKKKDVDKPQDIFSVNYEWNALGNPTEIKTEISTEKYSYQKLRTSSVLQKVDYHSSVANSVLFSIDASDELEYYPNGLLKQETIKHQMFRGLPFVKYFDEVESVKTFQYDNFHRITKEINTGLGVNRTYSYYPDGRLKQIADSQNNDVKNFVYDSKGRLVAMGTNTYTYDNFGNRISKTVNGVTKNYTYDVGGRLASCGRVNYYYNADGIRCKKICVSNGIPEKMYLDGGKIIGEDRANCKLRYFYDATGLKRIKRIENGFEYNYECVKDSMGSIVMLVDVGGGTVVCRYEYDALGNCTIVSQVNKIGETNPFKWKGFYYDSETGFYYANGSYYDPETGLYVDAAPVSAVFENADDPKYIDRNGTLCYNTLAIDGSPYTVSTTVELKEDITYSPGQTWWERLIGQIQSLSNQTKTLLGVACIAASVVLACLPGGEFTSAKLINIFVSVCIGIGTTAIGWAVGSAISGEWNVRGLADALANDIFFTGVLIFFSTCISTIKYICRSKQNPTVALAECAGNCFRKGTLVATADGLKPIEDIEVGDEVLAYDPETGEQACKPVVRLFRNTTDEWYHIHVNEQDITCTAEHPFYVADLGEFVPAKDLKAGYCVLLADGNCAVVDGILFEELSKSETTYNFEVEDYHTYYVSEDKVLVHNICADSADDGFEEWLNKGEANNVVYKAERDGKEVYTGITKQSLERRRYQHNYYKHKNYSKLNPVRTGLTRNQARSIETYLILTDGKSIDNEILSIAMNHRHFARAMEWARIVMGG